MKKPELIQQINKEKAERGIAILAHTYQTPDIIDIADITGDSYLLAEQAREVEADTVLLCGVRFMAETVKILSPQKKVILSHSKATCPMALQIEPERVAEFKRNNPNVVVCAYVNTTAELKAVSDVCVTSSSAVRIIEKLPHKDILFIPDQNLGAYVQSQLPEKNIILWDGCCPIHHAITARDAREAKEKYPNAALALHPECRPEVLALADFIGSTSAIIEFAKSHDGDVIIGTERGVADYLRLTESRKNFYQLREDKLLCENMKMTTLQDVYNSLIGTGGAEIIMDEELRLAALRPLDNMLKYGG